MPKQPKINSSSSTPTVSMLNTLRVPSVWFSDFAWAQLWTIIDLCDKEVGWFGLVDLLPSGDYLIEELFIPEQTVTSTETDITSQALNKLAVDLEAAGKDSSKLRYWGHSHVNMKTTPSMTDEKQIEEYVEHVDWFIRGIHNKRNESKVDVYDVSQNLIFQCVATGRMPIELNDVAYDELVDTITTNVNERWSKPHVSQFPHVQKGGNTYPKKEEDDVFQGEVRGKAVAGYGYGYGYIYGDEHELYQYD